MEHLFRVKTKIVFILSQKCVCIHISDQCCHKKDNDPHLTSKLLCWTTNLETLNRVSVSLCKISSLLWLSRFQEIWIEIVSTVRLNAGKCCKPVIVSRQKFTVNKRKSLTTKYLVRLKKPTPYQSLMRHAVPKGSILQSGMLLHEKTPNRTAKHLAFGSHLWTCQLWVIQMTVIWCRLKVKKSIKCMQDVFRTQ